MKISDDALLDAIWKRQLEVISDGVLRKWIGKCYSISDKSSILDYGFGSTIHIADRHMITLAIGRHQLLKRIRSLISAGQLKWVHRPLTFSIAGKQVEDAVITAIAFWKEAGLPSTLPPAGLTDIKFKDLQQQCHALLIEQHGQRVKGNQKEAA